MKFFVLQVQVQAQVQAQVPSKIEMAFGRSPTGSPLLGRKATPAEGPRPASGLLLLKVDQKGMR